MLAFLVVVKPLQKEVVKGSVVALVLSPTENVSDVEKSPRVKDGFLEKNCAPSAQGLNRIGHTAVCPSPVVASVDSVASARAIRHSLANKSKNLSVLVCDFKCGIAKQRQLTLL